MFSTCRAPLGVAIALLAIGLTVADSRRPVVQAVAAGCGGASAPPSDVLLCESFEDGAFLDRWVIGSNRNSWPEPQFVVCGDGFGFGDRCAAWSNHLVFDGAWGFWGFDAVRTFQAHSEFYVRWYQYVSDPFTWGTLEDKSVMLHGSANTPTAYVGTSRDHFPAVSNSGPGMPFVANYQDLDWRDTGGEYTKVNRFQNQGNDITLEPGRWYLFEWHVKLNTPGVPDGVTTLWIDDATEPVITQTRRLYYPDMLWLRSGDADKAFNTLRLTVYHQRCDGIPNSCPPNGPRVLNQSHRWDHVVVSKSPVGPVVPPAVTISAPHANAVVSDTIPLAASVNAAVSGVQFRVDGAPVGAEDTMAPYSLQWDTRTVADGPHTLTAVARDSAENVNTSAGVTIAVVNATAVTRVEETSPDLTYTSAATWIHGNRAREWSGETAALAFAAGQQVTLAFSGTGISWIGFRGPQMGVATVYLDGNLAAIVDAYSAAEQLGIPLFTASGLTPELHTLTIGVSEPRAKNRRSTDYFTVVDAFDLIGAKSSTGVVPDGTTRLEQTSALITYGGTWMQGNTSRSWSGGTAAVGFAEGQRATVSFVGTTVQWVGFRGPQTGLANVYLDGRLVATVDPYAPAEELDAVLFSATDLPAGPHALTIEATGAKNPLSTDRLVVVDAFDLTWVSRTQAP